MKQSIRCGRCGSRRLRRSHTPPGWAQYVRRWTPLRRYACGTCGHRGWTAHPLSETTSEPSQPPAPALPTSPLTPRPLEARDLRHRYARRRMVLRVALVATALGAGTAYLILVAGGWGS